MAFFVPAQDEINIGKIKYEYINHSFINQNICIESELIERSFTSDDGKKAII